MDTDRDDTVGGRQFTGVSSSACWRQTEGDRRGGGGRGGLGSGKILNREEQKQSEQKSERPLLKGEFYSMQISLLTRSRSV